MQRQTSHPLKRGPCAGRPRGCDFADADNDDGWFILLISNRRSKPAGSQLCSEWWQFGAHARGAFEHFTALTPGCEVTSGNSTQTLKAGETARYAADVPHRITNTSKRPAKGLLVVLYR
jgi:hypothetical protein